MSLPAMQWIGAHPDHWSAGRGGNAIIAFVIHRAGGSVRGVDSWFNTSLAARRLAQPNAGRSSAHCCIRKDGITHEYVKPEDTAFANGIVEKTDWPLVSAMAGINPNLWTYSCELEGVVGDALTDAQYSALIDLIKAVFADFIAASPNRRTIGKHDDITRTSCPGLSEQDMERIIIDVQGVEEDMAEYLTRTEYSIILESQTQYLHELNMRVIRLEGRDAATGEDAAELAELHQRIDDIDRKLAEASEAFR